MREHFPEALVQVPAGLSQALTCVPDNNDRHVLAAAIRGHANSIVTLNVRDFPDECLKQYDILRQTPDEFLVHQFHLGPDSILEKIDAQASMIRAERKDIIAKLRDLAHAPEFAALIESRS